MNRQSNSRQGVEHMSYNLNTYEGSDIESNDGRDRERDLDAEIRSIEWRRNMFLYAGTGLMVFGIVIGVVGLSMKWIDAQNFPKIIGGYCAILATFLSVFQIMEHLSAFADPDIQSRIIRILLMVPLYGTTSWLAMTFENAALVLDLIRDMYESYAIYTFFSLMMGLLGGTDALNRDLMSQGREPMKHPWPMCRWQFYFSPLMLHRIKLSILQFMILKPLCAIMIIILSSTGKYQEGSFSTDNGYIYMTGVYNISITAALYGLMYFYMSTKVLLKDHNPFMKFMCIKGVLFLSYWQSLLISILNAADVLPEFEMWSKEDQATGLQDFLICCEMLLFAILHKFVFGAHEYSNNIRHTTSTENHPLLVRKDMWRNFITTLKHEDVRDDFKDVWSFLKS
eukprot:TRINITY_DN825_c1_g2_i1.p1 TRINITY_DN825_c1_g2~~TRINITY_DN825_c1_g2_i1.p1  ORF type:complete len:396 (+),score=49.73 TRINITY_DN825_c1_g2_i1:47-1234(+)